MIYGGVAKAGNVREERFAIIETQITSMTNGNEKVFAKAIHSE